MKYVHGQKVGEMSVKKVAFWIVFCLFFVSLGYGYMWHVGNQINAQVHADKTEQAYKDARESNFKPTLAVVYLDDGDEYDLQEAQGYRTYMSDIDTHTDDSYQGSRTKLFEQANDHNSLQGSR